MNAKDAFGTTALILAVKSGYSPDIVRVLVDNGADVNAKDWLGNTALMWAAMECHTSIVRALLDKGADVNVKSGNGETALRLVGKFPEQRDCPYVVLLLKEASRLHR